MSFSSILQYLLMTVLVLATVFNLYYLLVGKRKQKQSVAQFKQTLGALENKAFEQMKRNKIRFNEKHGYINDLNEGILLTFDNEKRKIGITLKEDFYLLDFSDVLSCTQHFEHTEHGKIINITVEVETEDSIISLIFGSKPWKEKSYLAKFLLSDSQEFCTIMNQHLKAEEAGEITPSAGQ